jgi:hypothetical protein
MKGYLLFKDGRRQEMEPGAVGCIRFHRPFRTEDGRYLETVFVAQDDIVDGCIIYEEAETTDRTEAYHKAAEVQNKRFWGVIRKGLGLE